MSDAARRGGLGRGLGALIPTEPPAPPAGTSPSAGGPVADGPAADKLAAGVDAAAASDDVTAPPAAGTSTPSTASDPTAAASAPAAVPGATLADLPVDVIHANARQPRQVFDEDALTELAHSIREFGVLQPVVVRPDPAGGYELVMGERRLRAATAAGLATLPAIVRTTDDDAMLRDALLENIHRAQLNPLEEAAAYQQLLEEFGATHDELAQRIGRSRPQVSNTIRLLNLSLPVQRRVAAGVLSAGHARALLGVADRDAQDELAGRIVAEGLSVRATEELVALSPADGAPSRPRRSPARTISAPAVTELAEDLSDRFDTRVKVDLGRRKGRITLEFASLDDLERIVGLMAPDVAARRRGQSPAASSTGAVTVPGGGEIPESGSGSGPGAVESNRP